MTRGRLIELNFIISIKLILYIICIILKIVLKYVTFNNRNICCKWDFTYV